LETGATINRSVGCGIKGNLGIHTAFGTCHRIHPALATVVVAALPTGSTADRATSRLVLKPLFRIKLLFTYSESKFLLTVTTFQCLFRVHKYKTSFVVVPLASRD
jgi:hypothetical protein